MSVVYIGHTSSMRHTHDDIDICAEYNLNFRTFNVKVRKPMTLTVKVNGRSVCRKTTCTVFSPRPDAMNDIKAKQRCTLGVVVF